MNRILTAVSASLLIVSSYAAPPEAEVQGFYEGTWRGADAAGGKLEARVVAQGKNAYKVYAEQQHEGKKTAKVELDAKAAGEEVVFEGKAGGVKWEGVYVKGEIRGTIGQGGKFELERVVKKSPTLGKKPPEGASVLLDGRSFDEMVRRSGAPWYVDEMSKDGWAVWEVPIRTIVARQPGVWPDKDNVIPEGWGLGKERRRVDTVVGIGEDGSIRIPRGGMSSKQRFEGSFDLHVEFMTSFRPTARSQGRGNSGVYLPCGEEIQVLDSFGMTTYEGGGCGGLYRWKKPDAFDVFSLACYPPLTWQTFDVEYRVRKDEKGKPAGFVTVSHNGIKIHDNVKLRRGPRKGGFHFQDHGNPVRYRNIWVLPIKQE